MLEIGRNETFVLIQISEAVGSFVKAVTASRSIPNMRMPRVMRLLHPTTAPTRLALGPSGRRVMGEPCVLSHRENFRTYRWEKREH
jgi:hypothetical protein